MRVFFRSHHEEPRFRATTAPLLLSAPLLSPAEACTRHKALSRTFNLKLSQVNYWTPNTPYQGRKVGFPPCRNSLSNKTTRKAALGNPPTSLGSSPVTNSLPTIYSPARCLCHAGTQGHQGAAPLSPLVLLTQTPPEEATGGPQASGLEEALNFQIQFCPWMVYSHYSLADTVLK